MRNNQFKAKILIIGPENVGKSRIANFLADMNFEVPEELRPTEALRILEYDVNNVDINGERANVDVQLWDTSGNEKCVSYWPFLRKNADGIVFVYSASEDDCAKKLDYMHNYFVSQQNFSLRSCLVCALGTNETNIKLPAVFGKISQIHVNLDSNAEKFRQEFSKYIVSVVNNMNIK